MFIHWKEFHSIGFAPHQIDFHFPLNLISKHAPDALRVSLQVFPHPIQSSYVSLYLFVFAMQSSMRSVHDKRIMTMNVLELDCTFCSEIYKISLLEIFSRQE